MKNEKYKKIECYLKSIGEEREEKYLTDNEIESIAANARATVEMEGLNPSKEAEEISKRFIKGELSDEEAKKQILELNGVMIK